MIILSVLIAVLPERYAEFMKLHQELQRQITYMHSVHPTLGIIEILVDDRPSFLAGGPSIGGKRNRLRQRAEGKYSIFQDMDDNVAPNYIETLVRLAQSDADCLTFKCFFKCDNYWAILNMSLENPEDEQVAPERETQRKVWHVCAIKTEYTLKVNFDDQLNHGEDADFMSKIYPYLKTEAHSNLLLTQYNHSEQNSEADKIVKAGYK